MKVIVIGGGFLGHLIHHLFWPKSRVFDWRAHPPSILTRDLGPQYLWESIPELKCRNFMVHTTVDGKNATEASILAYKEKVGKSQDNSDWRAQFRPWMPGYDIDLPHVPVEYGKRVISIDVNQHTLVMLDGTPYRYDLLISTIPLPSLLQLCGISLRHPFRFRRIYMHRAYLGLPAATDDMVVNYISAHTTHVYRQTIRDGSIFTESLEPLNVPDPNNVTSLMPGKIYAHDESESILDTLKRNGILCFGRYATWRPDELAHETLHRIREYRSASL